MKKIDFEKLSAKLFKISIAISIIILICGIAVCICIVVGLYSISDFNFDGSDLSPFIKIIGTIALPVIFGYVMFFCIIGSLLIDGAIWGIYGIVRLISAKRWKILIALGIAVICLMLSPAVVKMVNTPKLDRDTIGYMAYDYNSKSGNTIYIKENDIYTPYLVLTYNYNGTNNALCLRKNVIGGEGGYIEDYNGTIAKSKVYDGWMGMQSGVKYEETDVDKYLTGNFLKGIDARLSDKICDTELSFSQYGYESGVYDNYEINRKFFLLSLTELGCDNYDNQTKNRMQLTYFNEENRTTVNDAGAESPYWTRTSDYGSDYFMIGYTGWWESMDSDTKWGVRPAFTIANTTKITEIYNSYLMQNIYVLA